MPFHTLQPDRPFQKCVSVYPPTDENFTSGQSVSFDGLPSPIEVSGNFDRDNPPTHFEPGTIPVFSEALVEFLEAEGIDNLQSAPACIRGADDSLWTGYLAVQVIGAVQCCDLEQTEHAVLAEGDGDRIPPLIATDQPIIDESRVGSDLLFFRIAEDPTHIAIRNELVDELIANKPDGGWGVRLRPAYPTDDEEED